MKKQKRKKKERTNNVRIRWIYNDHQKHCARYHSKDGDQHNAIVGAIAHAEKMSVEDVEQIIGAVQ